MKIKAMYKNIQFKNLFVILYALSLCLMCSSCTVYLKDAAGGSYKNTYEDVYAKAIKNGASAEQAHRQALLTGVNAEEETDARRKEDRRERRKKSGFKWFDIAWD